MRDERKQAQTKTVMAELGAAGSRLDYVAAWFLKAGAYFRGKRARIAFVATNSITQGEQVAQLWPALFDRYNLEITFGHRTFPWGSDARGKAHVHVVIIGLSDGKSASAERRLFSYENSTSESDEIKLARISPYLVDASHLGNSHLVVDRHRNSISNLPQIGVGTKPVDGGHYILDREERVELLTREPEAVRLLRPFILENSCNSWFRILPSGWKWKESFIETYMSARALRASSSVPRFHQVGLPRNPTCGSP